MRGQRGAVACISLCLICRTIAAPPAMVAGTTGSSAGSEFAEALEPRSFEFPRDHGPHPAYRQEWWYFTGNLQAPAGERFGFELTFFRIGLLPRPPADGAEASAWRTSEIYMAHFAITDVERRSFRFQQLLSRAALGLAGARSEPLRVWLDGWSVEMAPVGAGSTWKLHAAQPGYAIDLTLAARSAPVLNGEAGLSVKSGRAGDATYYYSVPRLDVQGQLLRDGRALQLHGLAWLDREWGSGALGTLEAGWDWFGLQLDDGSALMFYALRNEDGGRDTHSAGTWVAPDGSVRGLTNADVSIAVTGHWRNGSGERYPAGWRLRVPAMALDLSVRPVLPDQELRTTPPYWEGAVDVSGNRGARALAGRGYVELVGYAKER
ncbi:MAG TPA: lipocalin-like domain-containing protein [Steroidobacteraceae bacterium]|nr:lipocalin-like domain-containing protein [Steroidobacteraceae bacterium]